MTKALAIKYFSTVLFQKTDVILFLAIVFEKKEDKLWVGRFLICGGGRHRYTAPIEHRYFYLLPSYFIYFISFISFIYLSIVTGLGRSLSSPLWENTTCCFLKGHRVPWSHVMPLLLYRELFYQRVEKNKMGKIITDTQLSLWRV